MTHSWFYYSDELLGEKVPREHESDRRKQCVVVHAHRVEAAGGMNYSIAFNLDCCSAPQPIHRSDLSQPPLKISHGEEITHTVKTLSLSHSLQAQKVILPTNASISTVVFCLIVALCLLFLMSLFTMDKLFCQLFFFLIFHE